MGEFRRRVNRSSCCILAQGHLGSNGTLQQILAKSGGRGRLLVEITSSDPISVSTPVLPRTVPDVDTVTDSEYVVSALNSIDTLLAHPRERDGTAMFEVGGAQGSSPRSEHTMVLDVLLLHKTKIIEDDPGPTQVIEPVGKNRKPATLTKSWQTMSLRKPF